MLYLKGMMMKLENRYVVLKEKDLEVLSVSERNQLDNICRSINLHRGKSGRQGLDSLVIEKDWPEYSPALDLLSARVNKKN